MNRDFWGRFIKGHKFTYKRVGGHKHSEETKKKISLANKGQIPWHKGKKLILKHRKSISRGLRRHYAKKNSNYVDVGWANFVSRNSMKYSDWRESVLKRDRFRCQFCGYDEDLEVDHIKPFSLFPRLRFSLSNGRTLCSDCHKETDTYGYKLQRYKRSLNRKLSTLQVLRKET